jgi:hypothetical protein
MNSRLVLALVVVAAAVAAVFMAQGGFKITPADTAPAPETAATADSPDAGSAPDVDAIARLLSAMSDSQREAVLADEATFEQLVDGEAAFRALLAGARDNRMMENENIRLLMQRQADKALVDAYLRQLARVNLGPDFPTEEQLRKYFDDNRTAFGTPERVHLWQIFWPLGPQVGDEARAAMRAEAATVLTRLRQEGGDFAALAAEYSGHMPSRTAGGYMGLLNTADLLPGVRDAVMALEEGEVSDVVSTDSGLHIIRRGAVVPARENDFEEIRAQVRARLIQDADAQFRRAVQTRALDEYEYAVDSRRKAQWREALQQRFSGSPATE